MELRSGQLQLSTSAVFTFYISTVLPRRQGEKLFASYPRGWIALSFEAAKTDLAPKYTHCRTHRIYRTAKRSYARLDSSSSYGIPARELNPSQININFLCWHSNCVLIGRYVIRFCRRFGSCACAPCRWLATWRTAGATPN